MFLSIVIPVHNAAQTLLKCLSSIWSQGIPEDDYEVICVDDCSTDDSLAVLRQEATLHANLRILRNLVNLRAGGARNHGVREARGEYIQFIDSDDYFHPGSLLEAYNYQKAHRLDILVCDSSREHPGTTSDVLTHRFPNQNVMSGRQFMVSNSLPLAPWKYCFNHSLMAENEIWFEEKVNCEDVDWTHKMAFFAQTMQYRPILLVHYALSPDSETRTKYKSIDTIRNCFFCASRVWTLKTLFPDDSEKSYLSAVAMATFRAGALSMCSSYARPSTKFSIISRFFPRRELFGKDFLIFFVSRFPRIFSFCSTMVAPLCRAAIAVIKK